MQDRRIFYLSRNFGTPTGGTRVAHRHVELLCKNGFDACILLTTDETTQFFNSAAPTYLLGESFSYRPEDIFVIPELWHDFLKLFEPTAARKVVFCQNHFYTPAGIEGADGYGSFDVSTVFCCGDVVADYVTGVLGLSRAPVVHNSIDRTVFRPLPKKRQIAYMPRKMPLEAAFIRQTFRRRHPRLAGVPWVAIDGVHETEVARLLGESQVFLSLCRLEGLALPPLEAMAAGALVAGFHGDGGREFATPSNGLWCAAEDWVACADALSTALTWLSDDPAIAARLKSQAAATAAAYSLDRMERELVAFWREELTL